MTVAALVAPWTLDVVTLLPQVLRHEYTVHATHPDWADPIRLDATTLRYSGDETRAPRWAATVTAVVPDQDTLDLLDPRTGVRLELRVGYVLPGGQSDVHTVASLGLRTRDVDRPSSTMTLTAASDEAAAADGSPTTRLPLSNYPSTQAALEFMLTSAFGTMPPLVVSIPTPGPAVDVEGVTDYLDAAKDYADQLGADLYHDGLTTWVLEPRPVIATTAAAALKVGTLGTIVRSSTSLSRNEPWANEVLLRYTWQDETGTNFGVDARAAVEIGPFTPTGPAGYVTYAQDRTGATTQPAADAAAAALLARLSSRGRSMTLSAVAAYWLRPGHTVTVQLPTGPQERHLVSAVEFDVDTGVMDVTTRLPELVTITGE